MQEVLILCHHTLDVRQAFSQAITTVYTLAAKYTCPVYDAKYCAK